MSTMHRAMLGKEVGRGVRSVIYEWGADDVVKVPDASLPPTWIREELRLTDAVAFAGAMVPGRRRLVEVDGRESLACEKIAGASMWDELVAAPERAAALGAELAEIQGALFDLSPSYALPRQTDRLRSKIWQAATDHGSDLLAAADVLTELAERSDPVAVCHGDLHPSNILIGDDGRRVVVDWFDACRGSIAAEVARTSLLLDTQGFVTDSQEPTAAVSDLHDAYAAASTRAMGLDPHDVEHWRIVHRVARLAEGFGTSTLEEIRTELGRVPQR